jgi:hypothetical protein
MPDLLAYSSDALTARAQGAITVTDSGGDSRLFAGDATKLYQMIAAATTFEDVSKAGGYTTDAAELWAFAQYGQRIVATNFADAPQSYVMGSSTDFANLAAAAPKARYAAVVRDFLVLANTNDTVDGAVPDRVWWSGIDDPTSWLTPGTAAAQAVQSDRQDLRGLGGWNQGIVGNLGSADGAVFQERAVWRMIYVGPPAIFQFDQAEGVRGTPAPGSIVQLGAVVFYLGDDGFYVFDGTSSRPIGAQKIDKTFFASVNDSYFARITSAVDPVNKIVAWSVPSSSSADGTPDTLWFYNWDLQRWSTAAVNHQMIFRTLSFGQTLEQLDNVNASLDALPFSLDSRAYTGAVPLLAGFNTSKKLAYFNGDNLAATVETGEIAGGDNRRVFIQGIRPMVDGGTLTAAVGFRATPQAAVTFSTATSAGSDGRCPQRVSTRFARARVSIAAAGTWTHAKGVEVTARPEGLR